MTKVQFRAPQTMDEEVQQVAENDPRFENKSEAYRYLVRKAMGETGQFRTM
jgi:Arc/MetJ-type ribon-helix-helix transcriptional regulator